MLERLLRGVQLPSRAELSAERARRVAGAGGLPEGWERFDVFKPWVRLEEMESLHAELDRVVQAGVTVVRLVPELGGPQIVAHKGGHLSGPLVDTFHRRATIRFLLGLRPQWLGELPLGVGDCIGVLETRKGLGHWQRWHPRTECGCLVAAVSRAEEVEVSLERASLLAAHLAKCAHRVGRRERRRATRKARSSPTRARASGEVFERRVEPIRERPVRELEEVPVASRSLSAARLGRFPLSEQAFVDAMRNHGLEVTVNDRPRIDTDTTRRETKR